MRAMLVALTFAILVVPGFATAQTSALRPERGIYLTVFRSPATGVEWRAGHAGVHAGFYPTIIGREGESSNANFIRVGGSYYARPRGSTLYISPSLLISLDRNWNHGALTELGFRGTVYRTLHGRLGAAVLTTTDGEVRVNPTIGMDVRIGGLR